MTRTRSGSLAAGGLNWASLPLKLFAGGNAKFWDPADIDFTRDRADWEKLSDDERDYATRLCTQVHCRRGGGDRGHPAVHVRDAGRGTAGRRDVSDAVRVRGSQTHPGVSHVAGCRRNQRRLASLSRRLARLPPNLLRGVAGVPQRIVGRSLTGRPGPGVGHLQPHRGRHAGAHGLLRLAQDLCGTRNPSRHAGAGPAHR